MICNFMSQHCIVASRIWIFKACYEMPIYRLERAEDLIVVKRSAEPQERI